MGSAELRRPPSDWLAVRSERREHDEVLVMRPAGEITIATAAAFEDRLREALASRATRVQVDLGEVDFIDSIGLRTLIRVAEAFWSAGIELTILPELSAAVARTLRVTQLIDALPFAHDSSRPTQPAEVSHRRP